MKSEKDEINSELKAKFAELFDEVTKLKAQFAQQAERPKLKQLFDDMINLRGEVLKHRADIEYLNAGKEQE